MQTFMTVTVSHVVTSDAAAWERPVSAQREEGSGFPPPRREVEEALSGALSMAQPC